MTIRSQLRATVFAAGLGLLPGCVSHSSVVEQFKLSGPEIAVDYAEPPEPSDLAGVWIGFDQDELQFLRLELRSDFTGYWASVYPRDTALHESGVEAYRVVHWTIEDWRLGIALEPLTPDAASVHLQGRYEGFSLRMELAEPATQWKSKAVLYRESRIEDANRETRDALRQLDRR